MTPPEPAPAVLSAPALIMAMLDSGRGISDLIFSPARPPQVEKQGELLSIEIPGLPILTPEDTSRIALELVADNAQALAALKEQGACDFSYSIPDRARFRVNVFRQRGTFAIVMRVIASKIPTIEELNLPRAVADAAGLRNGIVLVTGPTGSGKSTTLAAIIDLINETRAEHILTIEDPIEFLKAVLEVLKSTMRTREYIQQGETEGKSLIDAMKDGELDGMQTFDGEIEKLVRDGSISMETALLYSTNAGNLQVQLFDVPSSGAALEITR